MLLELKFFKDIDTLIWIVPVPVVNLIGLTAGAESRNASVL